VLHYTGWIYDPAAPEGKGKRYISSRDRGEPLSYVYGYERADSRIGARHAGHARGRQAHHRDPVQARLSRAQASRIPRMCRKAPRCYSKVELLNVVPQARPADQ
jgi:hypothetical protein